MSMIGNPVKIREVWADNVFREFGLIAQAVQSYRYVTLDTEFPGFIINPHRSASDKDRYEALKVNVDSRKLIQVGLTLSDGHGNMPYLGGVWQFNFRDFDHRTDSQSPDSIELLRKSGIDFEKNRNRGIDSELFAMMLRRSCLVGTPYVSWITFHGAHDFGYLIKILTRKPLPKTMDGFLTLLSYHFGRFYDLKYMAEWYEGLEGGNLGLSRLAEILEVSRVGISHQAGSDSLLASSAFAKMTERFEAEGLFCRTCEENYFQGFLYGMQKEEEDDGISANRVHCVCSSLVNLLPVFEEDETGIAGSISHQAGSDGLLASSASANMREMFEAEGLFCRTCEENYFHGFLYGMQKEEEDDGLSANRVHCVCSSLVNLLPVFEETVNLLPADIDGNDYLVDYE